MQPMPQQRQWSGLKLPESILIVTNVDVFINIAIRKYLTQTLTTLLDPYHYLIYQILFRRTRKGKGL